MPHGPCSARALLLAALPLLTAACVHGAGSDGPDIPALTARNTPTDPQAIAAWATQHAPERLRDMNRPENEALPQVEHLETYTFGEPSPQNPQGQRVLRYRLQNGLEILLLEDHAVTTFAYQTWLRVGSRHERPGTTGIAHLFEHLLFKETRNMEEGEFDRIMEAHGAETNAATWVDWTMYREDLPAPHIDLAIRLEADRMEHMVLSAEQLDSEREVVKNERRYRVDNDPEGAMFELLYATAFTQHPYHWPTIGWMKDIEAITLDDCLAFYKTYYAPNNALLVIVGDIDPASTLAAINAAYGHMKPQPLPKETIQPEPTQDAERRRLLTMPLSSPKLLIGYTAPALNDPDHAAVEVAHQLLFGGKSGILYKRLVTDLEWVTDASAWVSEFTWPGLYEIILTLKTDADVDQTEAVVTAELQRLADAPLPPEALERARNQLEAQFLRNMQSVGERAYGLGHYAITAGDFKTLFHLTDRYRSVTPKDIQRVARTWLAPQRRTVILALPRPAGALP